MSLDKKLSNLICAYISIRLELEDTSHEILDALNDMGFKSETVLQLLGKSGGVRYNPIPDREEDDPADHKEPAMRLMQDYVQKCRLCGDEPSDTVAALTMMGYSCNDLMDLGLRTLLDETRRQADGYDFGYIADCADDDIGTPADEEADPMPEDPGPDEQDVEPEHTGRYRFEDYTLEECPNCESEVVIRASGISRCPRCGKPILPCTVCSSCRTPCPYGYTGRYGERLRPTNPPLSLEETDFYMEELERRKKKR